ncbi:CobW family GTP-binding protein [Shimia sp. SDUM112013]|uniref:CobW family GTP-binding protein n=1 Tax=Shimia sp. SDUM112013 TaxID=3136160 RepID=UPI0032EB912D
MSVQPLPLPMTVIGGYLGAGKTTLINRLLSEPHGLRLTLLVNDFGAINIDADLLASASDDTIELTNGCVCCTMGADLFMAIGDILDRPERPEHLIVEASGIADPASIARAAIAEPDLAYGGIVTVVDGMNYCQTVSDPLVSAQIEAQVRCADYMLVTKVDALSETLHGLLRAQSGAPISLTSDLNQIAPVVIGTLLAPDKLPSPSGHGHFQRWNMHSAECFSREALQQKLSTRPEGVFRMKGKVRGMEDTGFLVQIVGAHCEVIASPQPDRTALVAIGPAAGFSQQTVEDWWQQSQG